MNIVGQHMGALMLRYLLAISILATGATQANATHNRAGEITYRQVGPLTIEVKVTTYTKISSGAVDRDSLEFQWGDGTTTFIQRTNGGGDGVNIGRDIRLNEYVDTHTYPGRNTYTLGFQDPNRVGGILNVNWPNSIDVRFFLSTTLTFLDPQFDGSNSSPELLQPPVDIACVGKRFVHNPNAYDRDGDSLSYELVTPFSSANEEVPNYVLPDLIGAGPENSISLNPVTGEFVWESPQFQGDYNIAIKINEWRNGVVISSIIRDMQISVTQCDNEPPTIDNIEELCVIAGEKIELNFEVDDPDVGQLVIFTATGAPFLFDDSQATLTSDNSYLSPSYTASFEWQTTCNHISDNFYQVVLKAEDNFFGDSLGLVTLKTLRIKVLGPSPQELTSESEEGGIRLSWSSPYSCEAAEDPFFQGFSVWRKLGSSAMELDSCTTGIEKLGYSRIEFNTKELLDGTYTYLDEEVENGITYCYRVQAEFAQLSATGIPYNRIASIPSLEVCQQLSRDLPLLTKCSVVDTDRTNGSVSVSWTKPLPNDLDTITNPGPYTYEILYSNDGNLSSAVLSQFSVTVPHFASDVDTTFVHQGLNTLDLQHTYAINFYANGLLYGQSSSASTIYLSIQPSDMELALSWSVDVPWSNTAYTIYRSADQGATFTLLDSTTALTYTDQVPDNSTEYCYYIESTGTYALASLPAIIINDSQIACAVAFDNVPPCTPDLAVSNVCQQEDPIDFEDLVNTLRYTYLGTSCLDLFDTEGFYVYYSAFEGEPLAKIDSVETANQLSYEHMPDFGISGCYAVSAYDANRNESELSNVVCVDNCPLYELPNTFTPNGDSSNDFYTPTVNRFIESVDFKVYNEWGNLVWETTTPELLWDGNTSGNRELTEGTYYYTCRVFERRVAGVTESPNVLRGHINILR